MQRLDNLLFPLFARSLYPIDVFGEKTFMDAHATGHFRDIQLRKPAEYPRYFIVVVRFFLLVETADVNILINLFPADSITKTANLECLPLSLRSIFQCRKCLQGAAEGLTCIRPNLDSVRIKPYCFNFSHSFVY